VAGQGAALLAFGEEVAASLARARSAGVEEAWCATLEGAVASLQALTLELGSHGLAGEVERMMRHSTDYLQLFCVVAVGWQWLAQAAAAREALAKGGTPAGYYEGKLCAAQYWVHHELSQVPARVALIRSGEDSSTHVEPEWL
jgi:hypothetical protein